MIIIHKQPDGHILHTRGAPDALPENVRACVPDENEILAELPDSWEPEEGFDFQQAWKLEDGKIVCCPEKAKECVRDRIRQERQAEFEALDKEYIIAHSRDDQAALERIKGKQKALRDAPSHARIDQAEGLEALKLITLKDLI